MTFVACANAIEPTGAKPVLVDSEPGTGLIDLAAAEEAITTRTKAIMPVHLAGRPLDLDRINRLRDERKLTVLEDAAQAIGAEWHGKRIGNFGNPTAFSFYVTKNITTIEVALSSPSTRSWLPRWSRRLCMGSRPAPGDDIRTRASSPPGPGRLGGHRTITPAQWK
jgi:hypothetical protein